MTAGTDTGVSNAALSRFLSGERGLSAKALDTLGDYFGWEVVARGPKRLNSRKAR
jgi:hypothetical protein